MSVDRASRAPPSASTSPAPAPSRAAPPPRPTAPSPSARPQAAVAEGAGAGRAELPAAEGDDRRRQPPHRLRGGQLPQRRRVLGARHGDLHDPRRRLHPPLRLLQRADGQADLERPAGAAARRQPGEADGPAPRRRHLGRPRRPARLRGERLRRRDPLDPDAGARLQGRDPHPRLPRPGDAAGEGDPRAARRLQPQRRDGAAPLPDGPPRLPVPALGPGAADGEGDGRRRRRHQVGPDGRARRVLRGDGRDLRPPARAPRPGAHRRPVPAADREPPAGRPLLAPGRVRGAGEGRLRRSASSRSPPARWSAPATTPTRTCPRASGPRACWRDRGAGSSGRCGWTRSASASTISTTPPTSIC